MTSSFTVEGTKALNMSVTASPNAPQTQKPGTPPEKTNLKFEVLLAIIVAGIAVIVVVALIWSCVITRRKRKQKLKLMEEIEREDEERRKKKKKKRKRKRMTRGVKPVIPLKPSQELKKALNEFLELQTQTIGSVMDEDVGASKKGSQASARIKAAGSPEEDTEKNETSKEVKTNERENDS
ncbi:unnamed protein product [Cylicostephanus goldi]|uniref:Uncharacterized protein n=1 Tax=Cylicostephanus goldi TaxID=71465 RepID=A0A3P7M9Q9_CYLGO|nr:unnamed protein product [Cylicostephanus goldi]